MKLIERKSNIPLKKIRKRKQIQIHRSLYYSRGQKKIGRVVLVLFTRVKRKLIQKKNKSVFLKI